MFISWRFTNKPAEVLAIIIIHNLHRKLLGLVFNIAASYNEY